MVASIDLQVLLRLMPLPHEGALVLVRKLGNITRQYVPTVRCWKYICVLIHVHALLAQVCL